MIGKNSAAASTRPWTLFDIERYDKRGLKTRLALFSVQVNGSYALPKRCLSG